MKHKLFFILGWIFIGLAFQLRAQEQTMTLAECIEIAIQHNHDIVQSELQKDMYARDVLSATSRFLPSVNASLGYNHSVKGPSSKLFIDPRTGIPVPEQPYEIKSWNSSAGLNAQQMLFDASAVFGWSRAYAMKKSAEAYSLATDQTVIFTVKERYYELLKKTQLVRVQEENLKSSEESYKKAQVLFEIGKVPKSDVLRAKVQLENARLALIQAQNDLEIANANLNHAMGREVNQKIIPVEEAELDTSDIPYEIALEKALNQHPLLKKSKADLQASRAGMYMAAGQFLPSLYAYGGYAWRHEEFDQIKHLLDTDYNWYLGVELSVPVFQGFSRVAEVSKARLQHKMNKDILEQTKQNIALEVKQAWANLRLAKQQMAVTEEAERAAEEDLRLNKEKYAIGSGTMLELITAQAAYTQAQTNHIQAIYDYHIAKAQLEKAMGE